MNQVQHLDPAQVEIVQSRATIDWETVEEYAQEMRDGAAFPAIEVIHDGAKHWCWDGCHRIHAARQAEKPSIVALVVSGTRRDAVLAAAGANPHHGLRRKAEDKRRSVRMLLEDEEWSQWSNREIARRCNVSDVFVGKIRQELSANVSRYEGQSPAGNIAGERKVERGGAVYTMNTANIGQAGQQTFAPSAPRTTRIEDAITCLPAAARPLARTVLARYGANYGDDRLNLVLDEIHTGRYDSVQKAIVAATHHALAIDGRSHYKQEQNGPHQITQVIHSVTEARPVDAATLQTDVIDQTQKLAGPERRHRQPAPRPPAHLRTNPARYAGRSTPLASASGTLHLDGGEPDNDEVNLDEVREQTYALGRALLDGNPAAWMQLLVRLGVDVPDDDHQVNKLAAIVGYFTLYSNGPISTHQVRQAAGELQKIGIGPGAQTAVGEEKENISRPVFV